ncbi:MAG: hypothetical protein KDD01_18905 [Phaeodactylibacter sp.]|nr:hypothetical protein [Phaeodactylibacter sp.]MCB0616626.1 hypothetical protein [Phaeodactylibacter sp.]
MTQAEVAAAVRTILIQHFHIQAEQFSWELPLEALHEDFKILGYLVFLEQLLHQRFGKKIPLLENCSTAFHTAQDIVKLTMNEL